MTVGARRSLRPAADRHGPWPILNALTAQQANTVLFFAYVCAVTSTRALGRDVLIAPGLIRRDDNSSMCRITDRAVAAACASMAQD